PSSSRKLRTDLSGDPSFRELLGRVRETTLGAYAHQDLPFERVREEGATLFMTLLAAWQALRARWSGQDDVVVGSPIAGRTRTETEGLVGFFVNTLALRTDAGGDPAFGELLARVREGTLGAYAHQDLPFERLVEELGVGRSLAYAPLVQVTFALQNVEPARLRLGDAAGEPIPLRRQAAKFDLSVALAERDGRLAGAAAYAAALWDAATVRRLLAHFVRLLDAVAADPSVRPSHVGLLDAPEREQVLRGWNATAADFPPTPVHLLVSEQAARTPGALAVAAGAERLTYAELETRAEALAARLRALGAGPDSLVGICMERSAEMVVALLGVLRSGAAYVPLDPDYPAERVAYMLADSGARVLLTQERLAGRFGAFGGEVLCVDGNDGVEDADAVPHSRTLALSHSSSPDNLAYVIYTSGSTGRPKGVAVPHGALANHMQWMQRDLPLAAGDRVLQKTPFSFDASVWEFWAPLVAGATLVMAEPGAHREPARLARALADGRITVAQFVPALLTAVLEEDLSACTALRRVCCGGEALQAGLAAQCREALGAEVVNLSGPTEACIEATFAVADPAGAGTTVPIVAPVANARAYVLDPAGEPVPAGVPGELYLGGAGLARGYLGRPELTAGAFVPDALSGVAGARLYRTGDRVRRLADGALEYLGRLDQQVKLRGLRVELGEVEAALLSHPEVRAAAAVVREDVPGRQALVAYLVVGEEAPPTAELREWVGRAVPEYMVPGALVVRDALPTTPGGQRDRRALPAPDATADDDAFEAPRTLVEEVLAGIWASVLGAERVGRGDDFFALGGHSLLATQVVSRARAAFGVELPVRAVFAAPTLAGLAAEVEAAQRAGTGAELPPVVRAPRDGDAPLSFAQERLWFLDQLEPGSPTYHVP
ncbi:MAG TPA: amino acid adenylation domain-containing protein, partial [Longimicrobiaceae bacterium]|nr:amino acid adenylation domain-containing protein [Longimicrobiaceae bacterium]